MTEPTGPTAVRDFVMACADAHTEAAVRAAVEQYGREQRIAGRLEGLHDAQQIAHSNELHRLEQEALTELERQRGARP